MGDLPRLVVGQIPGLRITARTLLVPVAGVGVRLLALAEISIVSRIVRLRLPEGIITSPQIRSGGRELGLVIRRAIWRERLGLRPRQRMRIGKGVGMGRRMRMWREV